GDGAVVRLLAVAEGAEIVGPALRPVDLIEVEVIGLQARQGALDGLADMVPGEPRPAPHGAAIAAPHPPRHLAGKDDVAAPAPRLQPAADVVLGAALGLGHAGHRVELRGIDEVDAP